MRPSEMTLVQLLRHIADGQERAGHYGVQTANRWVVMEPCPYCDNKRSHQHHVVIDNGSMFVDGNPFPSAGSPKGVVAGQGQESPSATGMEPGQRCTREENHRDMFGKTGHMFIAWEDADWHYHYGTERFRCPYIQPSPAPLVTAEPPRCAEWRAHAVKEET